MTLATGTCSPWTSCAQALLCRPTAESLPSSPRSASGKGRRRGHALLYTQVMETLAANGDGQAEARRASHFRQRWRLSMESLLASARAPPASLAVLSEAGRLAPDEHDGPFQEGSFHARSEAGMEERLATSTAIMAQ